jgi:hypothetical protein
MEKNSFFCPHCDKECKIDAKSCLTCMDYNFNFEDRLKAEEDYDADL